MSLVDSWLRSLRAANRSRRTIDCYLEDVDYFTLWRAGILPDRKMKRIAVAGQLREDAPIEDATRAELEGFLIWCREARGLADATVARRFRSLQQFYGWLTDEDEIVVNPMAKMKPPTVVDQPPPIIIDRDMELLLEACRGKLAEGGDRRRVSSLTRLAEFEVRRDTALVTMLRWSGVRSDEIMGLRLTDVNLDASTFTVTGKGSRERTLALMPESADVLDRYLRVRSRHPMRDTDWLWLGRKGRLTNSGLRQMLERRCADAGIEAINPHRFRHTFAHQAKVRGMADEDLMQVAGWSTPQMLARYGRAASAERARASHQRLFGKG